MKKIFILTILVVSLLSSMAVAIPFPWGPLPFPPSGFTAEVQTRDAVVHNEPKCISRALAVLHEGDVVFLTGRVERSYIEIMAIVYDNYTGTATTITGWISAHTLMEREFELPNGKDVGVGQGDRTEGCLGPRG